MAQSQLSETVAARPGAGAHWALASLFSATLFLSAFLLFVVQPMFTKYALPLLGGAPNVWNTAMVFFQGALLCGYAYAHLLSKALPPHRQALTHFIVLGLGALFLPLGLAAGWTEPDPEAPSLWLLGLLAASIGVPFFAISATAPLLQHWFSRTSHPHAHDPYFLYATSNVGSMLALISYPILIEPSFSLGAQSGWWSILYWALALGIGASAAAMLAMRGVDDASAPTVARGDAARATGDAAGEPRWIERGRWILFAFVPAAMLPATTTHLTTNVASVPLLWVAPLALFLLTFVIVFARRGVRLSVIAPLHLLFVGVALVEGVVSTLPWAPAALAHLGLFFTAALICHGALAERRPPAVRLTEFFFCMSIGGVLGGTFVALAAPAIFDDVHEYWILLAAACAFRPGATAFRRVDAALVAGAALWAGALVVAADLDDRSLFIGLLIAALVVLIVAARRRPLALAAAALLVGFSSQVMVKSERFGGEIVEADRSFFGVVNVVAQTANGVPHHLLVHGDTIHNIQARGDEALERETLAYYWPGGPFPSAIGAVRGDIGSIRAAVVGLGAGALACFAEPGDDWIFYEIDPMMARVASDPASFSFLSRCTPDAPILLGDARVSLEQDDTSRFDIIFVDAFSSDSVPAHLISVEAMRLYRDRLAPGGIIVFNTSNRYIDVASLAIRLAQEVGFEWRAAQWTPPKDQPLSPLKREVQLVVTGAPERIAELFGDGDDVDAERAWLRREPHCLVTAWSDDYAPLVAALRAKRPLPFDVKNPCATP